MYVTEPETFRFFRTENPPTVAGCTYIGSFEYEHQRFTALCTRGLLLFPPLNYEFNDICPGFLRISYKKEEPLPSEFFA